MRKAILLSILCLIAVGVRTQDARVVELSFREATEAKSAYDDLQTAQKRWNDVQDRIKTKYKGFDAGLEFSSDFRFVVPKKPEAPPTINLSGITTCCNVTTAPLWQTIQ